MLPTGEFKSASKLMLPAMLIVGLVGFVAPAAASPAFNVFPISYVQMTDRDYPMIDARNVTTAGGRFSVDQSDHDNGVLASPGDEIEFQIYYHNGSVPEDEARNVIIRASPPGGSRYDHEVSAAISSDQTSTITSADNNRGGNIVIHISGQPQTLDFVSGSVRWYPERSSTPQTVSNSDNLVTSGINIGTVKGCFNFSGIVTFRARVGSQSASQNRDLSITKRVYNVTRGESTFQDSTIANPGDKVKFELRFNTSGNASQNNVILRDILPSQLTYVSGSMLVDGNTVGYEYDLFGGGRNFGAQYQGASHVATFDATVAGTGAFSGTTTVTNTANVRSDEIGTRQDQADVLVQLVLGISFSLRKTAFNQTQGADATTVGANPGDVLTYTLYYKNTGQTAIQNAVIEDYIHDVLELAEITNQGGATAVNSVIRYPAVDVPAGVEIARTFQVRVRDASLFPASSDLVMVNTYGNEVRVVVHKPEIRGVITPPRTGAGEWLAGLLAAVFTLGYWAYRRTRVKFQT